MILILNNLQKIKITIITYFWAFLYFGYYILFILFIRFVRLGSDINLINKLLSLTHFFQLYFQQSDFFQFILFFIIFWFLCNIKLLFSLFLYFRKYLIFNIWKIHFYSFNFYSILNNDNINKQKKNHKFFILYHKFISNFSIFYTYSYFCLKITFFLYKYIPLDNFYKFLEKYLEIIIRIFIILNLFILIGYECFYNNFILHYTFYYLFFYFLFNIWIRISSYFKLSEPYLDQIIFEIVYGQTDILYINLSSFEKELLLDYLNNPSPSHSTLLLYRSISDHPIINHKQFLKISSVPFKNQMIGNDNFIYFNEFNQEGFEHYDIQKIYNLYKVKA